MLLELKSPELRKFLDEQVRAGHFPSPEAAIEAAVAQLMVDQASVELSDEDLEAIAESDAQFDRGEVIDFDTFAAQMRAKYYKG